MIPWVYDPHGIRDQELSYYFLSTTRMSDAKRYAFCRGHLSWCPFSGLTEATCDLKNFRHVTAMADYALRLREQLAYVNEHSFNNFKIRVGECHIWELIARKSISPGPVWAARSSQHLAQLARSRARHLVHSCFLSQLLCSIVKMKTGRLCISVCCSQLHSFAI